MNKLILFALGIALGLYAINYAASGQLRAVQSGELTLICHMRDGVRVIEPGKGCGFNGWRMDLRERPCKKLHRKTSRISKSMVQYGCSKAVESLKLKVNKALMFFCEAYFRPFPPQSDIRAFYWWIL